MKFKFWNNRVIYLNHDSFHSMWLMYNYWVDWEEFNLLANYLNEDDVVADIGANMGFYTIWMSKFITKSGQIYSFEPDEKNFQRLQKNVIVNKLNNISLHKMAVSDVDGNLTFTTGLDGENHIIGNPEAGIRVVSTTLDSFVKKYNIQKFSYLKIDVEGFEYFLLKGANQLLMNRMIDVIQLEINNTINNSGVNISDLLLLLKNSNYYLCNYNVLENKMFKTTYLGSQENYFAVYDLEKVNNRLLSNRK